MSASTKAAKATNTVKLGQRPAHFPPVDVEGPLPDGTTGTLNVTFVYRTRSEYADFVDSFFQVAPVADSAETATAALQAPAGVLTGAVTDAPVDDPTDPAALAMPSASQYLQDETDQRARFLGRCIKAWDLDAPLGLPALRQLVDEMPGIGVAMRERYRLLVTEGRLGN
jgi:hypothetical protein